MPNYTFELNGVVLHTSIEVKSIDDLTRTPDIITQVTITTYDALINFFESIDWFYEYSDDPGVWRRGEAVSRLLTACGKLSTEFVACIFAYGQLYPRGVSPYVKWPIKTFLTEKEFNSVLETNIRTFKDRLTQNLHITHVPDGFLTALINHYRTHNEGYRSYQWFQHLKTTLNKAALSSMDNSDTVLIQNIERVIELATSIRLAVTDWRPNRGRLYDLESVTLPSHIQAAVHELKSKVNNLGLYSDPLVLQGLSRLESISPDETTFQMGRFATETERLKYVRSRRWFRLGHTSAVVGF